MLKKSNYLLSIVNLFNKLNIAKNDNILLHSNSAGINQFNIKKKDKKLYTIFINLLLKKIGKKGTLVMPTYNYDFAKGKNYNYAKSLGEVGELNNHFLNMRSVKRSYEPIFSHAIRGPLLNDLLNSDINNCFSENSIFGKFKKYNFKIFGFSCLLNSMTFLHFIEEQSKVNYRFYKKFFGKYQINNKFKKFKLNYFVGKKKIEYKIRHANVEIALKNNKSYKKTNFGHFSCWIINSLSCFKIIRNKIKKRNNYLIQKNDRLN
jgi:aminoglycoside 3-N-acetyltransferase